MKLVYRVMICSALLLCTASIVLAQWQYVANPQIEGSWSIGAASGSFIIQQAYAGRAPWVSSDGGDTWQSWTNPSGFPLPYATDLWPYYGALVGGDTVIFAIRSGSQIVKSTNFGHDWSRCDSNLNRTDLSSLAFSRGSGYNPQRVLLVGTPGAGIFLSADDGVHWVSADSGLTSLSITGLAASESALFASTSSKGPFRSIDNGIMWTPMGVGSLDSTMTLAGSIEGWVYGFSGKTFYSSTDDGTSWTAADTASLPAPIISLSLISTPGTGRGVAAFAFTSAGIYRLLGSDAAWQKLNTPTFSSSLGAKSLAATGSVLCYIDPTHIYRSTDLGNSWEWVSQNIGGAAWIGRSPKGDTQSALYTLNPYALSVSTDQGRSWRCLLEGIPEREGPGYLSTLAIGKETAPGGPTRLTVGTNRPGGIRRSEDGGKSWQTLLSYPLQGLACQLVLDCDTVAYATFGASISLLGDLRKSTDSGVTWDSSSWGASSDSGIVGLAQVRTQSGGRVIFWNNWFHLFRSSDDGVSWTESAFPGQGSSGRRLFATVGGTLYLANGGTVQSFYDSEGNMTSVYDSAAVYRSTDDGMTWENITGNLKAGFIRGLGAAASKEYPSRNFLAVSTVEDVWTSTEGGRHWVRMNKDGLPTVNGNPPASIDQPLTADADYIYLSGTRRRPWSDATITSVEDIRQKNAPSAYSLGQNYPNPFNPSTTIGYALPRRSHVMITVYNALGQKVATLINGVAEAGNHTVQFDGSHLASGVYFCRMQAESYVQTKKLTLIK